MSAFQWSIIYLFCSAWIMASLFKFSNEWNFFLLVYISAGLVGAIYGFFRSMNEYHKNG